MQVVMERIAKELAPNSSHQPAWKINKARVEVRNANDDPEIQEQKHRCVSWDHQHKQRRKYEMNKSFNRMKAKTRERIRSGRLMMGVVNVSIKPSAMKQHMGQIKVEILCDQNERKTQVIVKETVLFAVVIDL